VGKLGDLNVELAHFLIGDLRHPSAGCAARISHVEDLNEFLQREAGGERILHEAHSTQ
jgi:hypothetical protein